MGVAAERQQLPGGAQGGDLDVDSKDVFTVWKLQF